MKIVLITGSNGLLGQKLVYLLSGVEKIRVVATSKGENRMMRKNGYVYEPLDITNLKEIEKLILRYYPDVIINTAAITSADQCESDHKKCYKVNVKAVENLVKAANYIYAQVIQLSTDFIFDGKKGKYLEEDDTDPLSYYGKSKLESEMIVKETAERWALVRTSLVYGVTGNSGRTNFPLMVKQALTNNQKIRVNNDQYRTPTLAEDLAAGISAITNLDSVGIYHIAGAEYMSVLDIALKTAEFFSLDKSLIVPVKSADLNEVATRPLKAGLNIDKARVELKFSPHTFRQGLEIISRQM
ncbi:MAG: SDR family oxidoreductase [Bacteroidia bacterium]|nr:SDR family oxidoreductase [Bacteroidia bacterium]